MPMFGYGQNCTNPAAYDRGVGPLVYAVAEGYERAFATTSYVTANALESV